MRGGIVFCLVLVLAGFCAAGDVWAQVQIQPIGPSCVPEDASSSLYEATVTTNYNFDFSLKVYLNGIKKHDTTTPVTQSGPTYNFSKTVSHSGWNMVQFDTLDYVGRATLTSGPHSGSYDEKTWSIFVDPPGGCNFRVPVELSPASEGEAPDGDGADRPCAIREEYV